MAFHFICANHDREYLAKRSIVKNAQGEIISDNDPMAQRTCCHCLPSDDCGDKRSRIEDDLKKVKYEQGQITEMMKKRYPELYGIGQQELGLEEK